MKSVALIALLFVAAFADEADSRAKRQLLYPSYGYPSYGVGYYGASYAYPSLAYSAAVPAYHVIGKRDTESTRAKRQVLVGAALPAYGYGYPSYGYGYPSYGLYSASTYNPYGIVYGK